MKLRLIFYIVYKYLFSRKYKFFPSTSFFITILGNSISIAALIIVMSVMNGFRGELLKIAVSLNPHVKIFKKSINENLTLIDDIKTMDEVAAVFTSINNMAIVMKKDNAAGVGLKSISLDEIEARKQQLNLVFFDEKEFQENKFCCIIGLNLLNSLNAVEGKSINVITASKIPTPFGMIPRYSKIKICGVFSSGSFQFDSNYLFLKEEAVRDLFSMNEDMIDSIDILIKEPYKVDAFEKKLLKKFDDQLHRYDIFTWETMNKDLLNALKLEASIMRLLLSMFVILTSFIMMNTMKNLVKEKTREVAILISMGVDKKDIIKIFFFIGLFTSLFAIVIGAMFGVLCAANIESIRLFLERFFHIVLLNPSVYLLSYLPSKILITDVFFTIFFTLIVFIPLSFIYARQAIKQEPAETLKQF